MYKLKFKALACNRQINEMMKACDLIKANEGIGEPVEIVITTATEPTVEYIEKMEKHIENIPADILPETMYVGVKFAGVVN